MTKKFIIITSIFSPTEAVKAFAALDEYKLIVVGDNKTPKDWHEDNVIFYPIEDQLNEGGSFARLLPENHYTRKMLGYLKAAKMGANIIIDTDDDNIPKTYWSFPSFEGRFQVSEPNMGFVNTYSYFTDMHIWPRGLPLSQIKAGAGSIGEAQLSESETCIGVWQGLADEDPDVDAIYRLTNNAPCFFSERDPIVLKKGTVCPFNSQNTAFRKELFALLYLPAFVTFRFTDILRGLVAQPIMWLYDYYLGFTKATVIQKRNEHDYTKDFESEIPCYLQSSKILEIVSECLDASKNISDNLCAAYAGLAKHNIVCDREVECVKAWCSELASQI
ncbi:MAG: STELLO glycosyltransferase family protein [Armatimonadota bacterium]|nr:STELLO glycosyltransferase family protein [bacterium]